jgi:hypothetical protein
MKKLYSKLLIITVAAFSLHCFTSCVDLDITPKNILTAEDIYTEGGIRAYMAGMYRSLPMEDFHFRRDHDDRGGYFHSLNLGLLGAASGEASNSESGHGGYHRATYWNDGFQLIRQANTLIADLPNYPELASQSVAWIAEAKFIRAYVYFKLVKRYGGMPIIEEPQVLDVNNTSNLHVARVSHADTYDFILQDLDDAIAGLPATSQTSRVNRYIAAGLKSRVALSAATTARYGSERFEDWELDGILLQGIPTARAQGYFKQAYDAAKMIEGRYSLHDANPDRVANFAEIWERAANNSENMWLRQYDFNVSAHSWDAMMSPVRMTTTYGGRFGIPLDWVELFDGLPLCENGRFYAFDDDGYYIVYDNARQMWEATEPRLQAQLLLPGTETRGIKVDFRSGTFHPGIDPDVDRFKKFSIDDGATNFHYINNQNDSRLPQQRMFNTNTDFHSPDAPILTRTGSSRNQPAVNLNGNPVFIAGLDGPTMKWSGDGNTNSGLHGRKFINLDMPLASVRLHQSVQPWIEMRYAEIVLNRAEAAIEIAQGGDATYNGVDMLQDAFESINAVRRRAGANLLTSPAELSTEPAFTQWTKPGPKGQGGWVVAPNRALQILRVERYKELSNEAIIYWDLRRWFTFDLQFDGFNRRGLYSFMFSKGATIDPVFGTPDGRYIFDAKQGEHYSEPWRFDRNRYYDHIPGNQLANNPLLQRNRGQ